MPQQIGGIVVYAIRAGALQFILTITAGKQADSQRPRAAGRKRAQKGPRLVS